MKSKEEQLAYKREQNRKWRLKHKDHIKEYRDANKEYWSKWRKDHPEYMSDYSSNWRKNNQEYVLGRANNLLNNYKASDKKYNRGESDLTAKWIVENIFTKPCAHCGKTGWKIIGCNRLDNTKPHTMDNVEPCCFECNIKLSAEERHRNTNGTFGAKKESDE